MPRLEYHFFKRSDVCAQSDLAFRAAVDVVENGPRDATLGQIAEVGDVYDAVWGRLATGGGLLTRLQAA
jgi:hypothetical protein